MRGGDWRDSLRQGVGDERNGLGSTDRRRVAGVLLDYEIRGDIFSEPAWEHFEPADDARVTRSTVAMERFSVGSGPDWSDSIVMAYISPIRNPLRRLPIRQYQGPFRNRLPGLGDAPTDPATGLPCAAGTGTDLVPCIPSIGTSAGVTVTPNTTTVTGQGASAGYQQSTPAAQPSFTDWLNTNSSTVLWIAGIGLGVMFLSRLTK